jgi:hypothetical protein
MQFSRFLIFPVTFFYFGLAAETSEDYPLDLIKNYIQELAALAYVPECGEFREQVVQFVDFLNRLSDEPNVFKMVYHEFTKQPDKFILEFVSIVTDSFNFTGIDPIKQVCDALILRCNFLPLHDFSMKNLTEEHIQAGKKIFQNFSKIDADSEGYIPHVGIVLDEVLGHLPIEDLVLFPLLVKRRKTIDKYLRIMKTERNFKFDFKSIQTYSCHAFYTYECCCVSVDSQIMRKFSNFGRDMIMELADHVLCPIISLKYGVETFQLLADFVKLYGEDTAFDILRPFTISSRLAFFMILYHHATITAQRSDISPESLEELHFLIDRPLVWFDQCHSHSTSNSLISFIRDVYLTKMESSSNYLAVKSLISLLKSKYLRILRIQLGVTS